MESKIYHICKKQEWESALKLGSYAGSSQDQKDGFIHFSSFFQVVGSAAKHREGQKGLVLLSVDPERLGEKLKWEGVDGGELFPHLYGVLPTSNVCKVIDLPLGQDGKHQFPNPWF